MARIFNIVGDDGDLPSIHQLMGEKERTGGLVEKNDLSILNIGQRFFAIFFFSATL